MIRQPLRGSQANYVSAAKQSVNRRKRYVERYDGELSHARFMVVSEGLTAMYGIDRVRSSLSDKSDTLPFTISRRLRALASFESHLTTMPAKHDSSPPGRH